VAASGVTVGISEGTHLMEVLYAERDSDFAPEHSERSGLEAGIWGVASSVAISQQFVAHMPPGEGPVVVWVAGHLGHPTRCGGVVSADQVVLVEQRCSATSLHHPYMEEVISETKERDVNRDMEIGGPVLATFVPQGVGLVGSGPWGP
jgi:hypothetical protein